MIDAPTIVLAALAVIAFTIIAISAPKVIRQHRQDVLLRKFSREFVAAFEAAAQQLAAAFAALMPAHRAAHTLADRPCQLDRPPHRPGFQRVGDLGRAARSPAGSSSERFAAREVMAGA